MASFKREVTVSCRLQHPYIVRCFGATMVDIRDPDDESEYSVVFERGQMSLRGASNLGDYFEGPADKLVVLRRVAEALLYLHTARSPVVHRDIKMENVMMREDGTPMLIDFGLAEAKMTTMKGLSKMPGSPGGGETAAQQAAVGYTLMYAAPEVLLASRLSGETMQDVYSFGCLMYELLSPAGTLAWAPDSDIAAAVMTDKDVHRHFTYSPEAEVPSWVQELTYACTQFDPSNRPTIATVYNTLNHQGAGSTIFVRPSDIRACEEVGTDNEERLIDYVVELTGPTLDEMMPSKAVVEKCAAVLLRAGVHIDVAVRVLLAGCGPSLYVGLALIRVANCSSRAAAKELFAATKSTICLQEFAEYVAASYDEYKALLAHVGVEPVAESGIRLWEMRKRLARVKSNPESRVDFATECIYCGLELSYLEWFPEPCVNKYDYAALAQIQYQLGNEKAAVQCAEAALKIDSAMPQAMQTQIRALSLVGSKTKYTTISEKYLSSVGQSDVSIHFLDDVTLRKLYPGDIPEVPRNSDPITRCFLAAALEERKEKKRSAEIFAEVVHDYPRCSFSRHLANYLDTPQNAESYRELSYYRRRAIFITNVIWKKALPAEREIELRERLARQSNVANNLRRLRHLYSANANASTAQYLERLRALMTRFRQILDTPMEVARTTQAEATALHKTGQTAEAEDLLWVCLTTTPAGEVKDDYAQCLRLHWDRLQLQSPDSLKLAAEKRTQRILDVLGVVKDCSALQRFWLLGVVCGVLEKCERSSDVASIIAKERLVGVAECKQFLNECPEACSYAIDQATRILATATGPTKLEVARLALHGTRYAWAAWEKTRIYERRRLYRDSRILLERLLKHLDDDEVARALNVTKEAVKSEFSGVHLDLSCKQFTTHTNSGESVTLELIPDKVLPFPEYVQAWREMGVTDNIIDSFTKIYNIAAQHNTDFTELFSYVIDEIKKKEKKDDG